MGHWGHFLRALYPKGTSCWLCLKSEFQACIATHWVRAALRYAQYPKEEFICRPSERGLTRRGVPSSLKEEGCSDPGMSLGDIMQTERSQL